MASLDYILTTSHVICSECKKQIDFKKCMIELCKATSRIEYVSQQIKMYDYLLKIRYTNKQLK